MTCFVTSVRLLVTDAKSLTTRATPGKAPIKSSDFDASIIIDQSDENPKEYRITTELPKLHNELIAADPRPHNCFNAHCDALVVTFPTQIKVADKIDAVKDIEALAVP